MIYQDTPSQQEEIKRQGRKIRLNGFRSPDSQVRSESLCRLRCRGHILGFIVSKFYLVLQHVLPLIIILGFFVNVEFICCCRCCHCCRRRHRHRCCYFEVEYLHHAFRFRKESGNSFGIYANFERLLLIFKVNKCPLNLIKKKSLSEWPKYFLPRESLTAVHHF